MNDEESGRGLI